MTNPLINFVEKVCVQTAVYWGSPVPSGSGGNTYADPVEISCRWDGKGQMVWDNNGKEVISKAEILVTQDVDLDGFLFLGSLDDLESSEEENPEEIEGAYKILSVVKTPLFMSSTEFVRTVYL